MRSHAAPGARRATIRDIRRDETAALLASDIARAAIALHGTPVLLLDPERVRRQYRRLAAALPFVRFHYAVKALSHDAVIAALADEGCGFDVATGEELALLDRGVDPDRIIHTHPIKKASEIAEAIDAGVRTFVIDNEVELEKFVGAPADVRLLVRLAYRSPHAKSDLSTQVRRGAVRSGASASRGRSSAASASAGSASTSAASSTIPPASPPRSTETLALMDHLESRARRAVRHARHRRRLPGRVRLRRDRRSKTSPRSSGPCSSREPTVSTIIAEPGRVLVAESMTLVTSVVGIAERGDGRWYYLDDGLYGSYSNVLTEDVHPLDLRRARARRARHGCRHPPLGDARRTDLRLLRRHRARGAAARISRSATCS